MRKGSRHSAESRARMSETLKESMTPERKAEAVATLRRHRRVQSTIPEKAVRYVLNVAGVDYEPQVGLEWAPDRFTAVDVLVKDSVVVEVYGDFVHANPERYPDGYVLRPNHDPDYTAKDRREHDAAVRAGLESRGYRVIVVWHSELKDRTADAVKRVLDGCGTAVPVPFTAYGYHRLAAEAKSLLDDLESHSAKEWQRRTKDRHNRRFRERYRDDPGFREKIMAKNRSQDRGPANAARRLKRASDDEYRDGNNRKRRERRAFDEGWRDATNERRRDKRADDSEWKNADNERRRERRRNDPDWADGQNRKRRERYSADQEYRETTKAYNREQNVKHGQRRKAQRRERCHSDPGVRAKAREAGLKRYAEKHEEIRDGQNKKYSAEMPKINARLADVLGGACRWCGNAATDIRSNKQACDEAGHKVRRGLSRQWYVDNPAEAAKFLHLACPEHAGSFRNHSRSPADASPAA